MAATVISMSLPQALLKTCCHLVFDVVPSPVIVHFVFDINHGLVEGLAE
jgi:hypothetical protein